MNLGSDPADQVVRYTLEGTEYALRLSGTAAKNFAIFVAAVLRDQKKTRGKTNLTRLLREGKPLKFFSVLPTGCGSLRRRPSATACCLSRCATATTRIISRSPSGPTMPPKWSGSSSGCNWMWWRPARPRLCRMSNPNSNAEQTGAEPDHPATQTADSPIPFELDDADYDLGFTQPAPSPAESGSPPPSRSTRRTDPPSAPPSASRSRSPNISPASRTGQARGERPSVRDELRSIKAMLRQRESVTPRPKTPIRIHRGGQAR